MKLSIKTGLLISCVSVFIISSNVYASTANVEDRVRQNVQQLRNDPELRGATQVVRNNENVNRLRRDAARQTAIESERVRVRVKQQAISSNSGNQIKQDMKLKPAVTDYYKTQKTDAKSY